MPSLLRFVAFCSQRFIGIPDITQSKTTRNANNEFLSAVRKIGTISYLPSSGGRGRESDILSPAVREQLRSLRVNRGKNFSDQREIYR